MGWGRVEHGVELSATPKQMWEASNAEALEVQKANEAYLQPPMPLSGLKKLEAAASVAFEEVDGGERRTLPGGQGNESVQVAVEK